MYFKDNDSSIPSSWLDPLPLRSGAALPNRLFPGPMHGLTTGSFCAVMSAREYVWSWIAPFIRISTDVPRPGRLRRRLSPFIGTGLPVIAQLMGSDIDRLCGAGTRLRELGVAGIDLNCACPAKSVLRHGAGGDCLRRPEWLRRATTALRQVCGDCAFSVKLRAGFTGAAELPAILSAVRAGEPDLVIMHCRTVREEYRPVHEAVARLALARELLPETPLIGSGDLYSVADAARMYAVAGVDGVAPARGLLRNPKLLRDLADAAAGRKAAPLSEQEQVGFLLDLAITSRRTGSESKGFLAEIARHMFGTRSAVFLELGRSQDLDEAIAVLHSHAGIR